MIDTHVYKVELVGADEKTGTLTAIDDRLPEMAVASPPEFGGPGGKWSPEHLYVASLSSCLMTTFRSIAANSGVEVLDYSDEATGRLQRGEDRLYSIDKVTLRPTIVVATDSRVDRVERLVQKAEQVCLISRSVTTEVTVEPRILQAHQLGT